MEDLKEYNAKWMIVSHAPVWHWTADRQTNSPCLGGGGGGGGIWDDDNDVCLRWLGSVQKQSNY